MTDPKSPGAPQGTTRPSRASLLARGPDEVRREGALEQRIEGELRKVLTRRLLSDNETAGAVDLVLLVVVAVLLWGKVPAVSLVLWLAIVGLAGLARAVISHRLSAMDVAAPYATRALRGSVLVHGLAWAAGTAVIAPGLPQPDLALIVVVFVGLVAAATVTLIADAVSFYGFTAVLLGPLALTMLLNGQGRFPLVAIALVAVLAVALALLYRRFRGQLLEHLRTAKRLELSEAEAARDRRFLDALLSSAPDAIVAVGRDGRALGINPSFERLFGYTADEVVGREVNDLIVPESQLDAAKWLHEELRAGRTVVAETERRHKDGDLIAVRVSAASAGREAEGAAFVLYEDLTAVKLAERALREAQEQYRELVESATDLVWQLDREGRWTFLNAACARIYGAPAEELLGRPFTERVDPEHLERDLEAFRAALRGAGATDYETVHRDVRGTRKHLSFASRPVRGSTGTIVGARGIARDVSERVAAREALEAAREAAVRTAQTKSAFLATVSHEIRTPMNGVLGMLELLLDGELTGEQRRSAEFARSSAEALLTVINDVLDFSKIEAGQVELEEVTFDLPSLVSSVVRLLAVQASERGLELVCDVPPEVPRLVRGDPGRLRQVLTNLVGNAVKFTESGEVVVSVSLEAQRDGNAVTRFAVRDTGVGIPADKLETIFEEFTQGDVSTTREYGGTGLGLTISRRLVRLMGSDIRVTSAPGQGSVFGFSVAFPVEPLQPAAAAREMERLRGVRALVVDDNPTNRRVVREILGPAGVAVDEVSAAGPALERLRRARMEGTPYVLAILDAFMPGQDGFEMAEAVRSDPELRDIKLMMLTSAGQRGDGQRCRELGIDAYLTKPASRLELLEVTAAVLAGSGATAYPGRLITRYSIRECREPRHILLAEDNPVNQQITVAMLRRRGHTVDVVENGRQAVEAVARQAYDAVLMDVQMPGMDGVEATREIRRDPKSVHLPIVALTAHAIAPERERCHAAGMSGYVVKPFKPHELFAVVEGWALATEVGDAPVMEAAESAPPVALEELRGMMREAGAEEAVDRMLEVFVVDAPERMAALEVAVASGDAERIREAAHAYKSAAGTMAAYHLAALLEEVERAGRAGDSAGASQLLGRVRQAHDAVLDYLEASQGQDSSTTKR
ncbi:MAG: response regulator [Gemmatimonadales bacterium]|nr:response regulator [Gemmatimonadales bacterium]NIN11055.1 response regulator [Gemmatimonadales bacterium]NIN49652.1 response regulator [Gemmatimonadales bacterium]NIP07116.1 response regulator [Gemmatimonadales bacterium]NIQ99507.1 response regulator [Gemmatimonadales bacterium]